MFKEHHLREARFYTWRFVYWKKVWKQWKQFDHFFLDITWGLQFHLEKRKSFISYINTLPVSSLYPWLQKYLSVPLFQCCQEEALVWNYSSRKVEVRNEWLQFWLQWLQNILQSPSESCWCLSLYLPKNWAQKLRTKGTGSVSTRHLVFHLCKWK